MKVDLKRFEHDSKLLESIATRFQNGSPEYTVLRRAAFALFYIAMTKRSQEFDAFIADCERDLSAEEQANLREWMG